ncbi:alpha-galactosidase [Jeotgalibaca caeni]|uniref:alpha-galactosidase n=1 Tax=Jeotgalibaca caeni TaxID=3028623 RepID=UPI00237DBD2A|nr:alpha-galactosidase [Jeotgalibaca caeni]MDE1549083.1 alpha-galactosidase [Jeotgalibaca caeni]
MLVSNIGLILSFLLLFSTHRFSGAAQVVVFLVALVFHKIVYSFQQTVTKAAQPALTSDPKQRPLFSIYDTVNIEKMMSVSMDSPHANFDLVHLNGSWARETQITREPVSHGIKVIDSKRGASSHQQNPFLALVDKRANDLDGEVYGFSLIYSGNFVAQVQVDSYSQLRVNFGINPFQFNWKLQPGQSFQTPEAVLVYSQDGLNGMSQQYHNLYREHLLRGIHQRRERPILINNWEATYFNFTEDTLLPIVEEASKLGIELFVLDDGWYGQRNSDMEGLGDWEANTTKFPRGLAAFSKKVKAHNMKFGLWVEPEMVSENSDLYREHPDWCIQVEGRGKSLGRGQYVLDFSRKVVRDHIEEVLTRVFKEAEVDYVKWDMNRHITEAFSSEYPAEQQGEVYHRYILGLYDLLEKLTTAFPNILFEGCSGGGGRFDPGMLYYMPQTWTSDNTDPISRLKIQYGTSLVYPILTMGAHVSASPNHQIGRVTSLKMRGDVASAGNLGYELDILALPEEGREKVANQVAFYKRHRQLIQFGDFYRLISPFDGNECAWMFVSKDKKEALVFYYKVLNQASEPLNILKMEGLDPSLNYYFEGAKVPMGGDELMHSGMFLPADVDGDHKSFIWYLNAEQ